MKATRRDRVGWWLANKIIQTICTQEYEVFVDALILTGFRELEKMPVEKREQFILDLVQEP